MATVSNGVITMHVIKPDITLEKTAVRNSESRNGSYLTSKLLQFEKVDSCTEEPAAVRNIIPLHPLHRPTRTLQ